MFNFTGNKSGNHCYMLPDCKSFELFFSDGMCPDAESAAILTVMLSELILWARPAGRTRAPPPPDVPEPPLWLVVIFSVLRALWAWVIPRGDSGATGTVLNDAGDCEVLPLLLQATLLPVLWHGDLKTTSGPPPYTRWKKDQSSSDSWA
jgi:hypothetical protein